MIIYCKEALFSIALSFSSLLSAQNFEQGIVTLTFDDGYSCHYETVLPLLEKYGACATFYVTSSLLNQPGYLTSHQVIALSKKGHEIASHCSTHRDLKKLSFKEVEVELLESKRTLEKLIQTPVLNFAPPFGAFNPTAMYSIKRHYQSSRTIMPGMNVRNLNPYLIQGYVVRNSTSLKELEEWIQKAITDRKWLVLVYHYIDDTESLISVSKRTFEKHLQLIQRLKIATATIRDVLKSRSQVSL